ncbi:ROK family protein [Candidatus Woesearchaeota archaeon]|nr:ROK family protein [Candidatus Woesearchaeota archaeon]
MKYAIGLDIGGTKIEGILVNEKGTILDECRIQTEAKKGKKTVTSNIKKIIRILKVKKIVGIGISTAGFVDSKGAYVFSPNMPLLGVNLKKELEKEFKTQVYVANDANCFALAEAILGAGKNSQVVFGLIWGTGIGGGLVINKKIYSGSIGGASEVGHMVIDASSKQKCGCGQTGHFESLCSGPNIIKRYKKAGGKKKIRNPKEIFELKDKIAKKIIKETVKYMGVGLANITNAFNPDIIVAGGGVSNLNLYKEINKELKKRAIPVLGRHVKFVKNKIGDSAGVLGAAMLAF